MNKIYLFTVAILSLGMLFSCSDDERSTDFIESVAPPSDVDVAITVSEDNSGIVTFTPTGTSVSSFTLNYGDGSEADTIIAGQTASHVYNEGTFTVVIQASSAAGDTQEITREVSYSFLPPEEPVITITSIPGDSFGIEVTATAIFATNFDVFFGEVANETPVNFAANSSATYVYETIGEYEVRVVARNGGSETTFVTQTVTIVNPIVLPLDFEDETQEYVLVGFEGAASELVDNPVAGGINTSSKVIQTTKMEGAQFFAGTFTDVDLAIDFSNLGSLSIKTYSPKANIPVRIRIENNGNTVAAELDANTTVENEWETLVYDFSSQLDPNADYIRIVVFFEFVPGLAGDGTTYYFDDIQVAN